MKLTSIHKSNGDKSLSDLYPRHFFAFDQAKLLHGPAPTLADHKLALDQASSVDSEESDYSIKKRRREKDQKRAIYLKAGFTDYWRKPIPQIIKEVKAWFPTLSWLRVSLSYHQFQNLRELLQGDLNTKLNQELSSLDFKALSCNCCNKRTCAYLGKCRSSIVVYQATCLKTRKKCIGNTQQHVKTRIQQHVQDTKKLVINGDKSDSFANHFTKLVPPGTEKKKVREFVKVKVDILWHGNPISCVKTFGTQSCKLCAKERITIIKLIRFTLKKAINKCNELYGACCHKPWFHKFEHSQFIPKASPDASAKDKRLSADLTTKTQSSSSIASLKEVREPDTLDIANPLDGTNLLGYNVNFPKGLEACSSLQRLLLSPDEGPRDPLQEILVEDSLDSHGDLILPEHLADQDDLG